MGAEKEGMDWKGVLLYKFIVPGLDHVNRLLSSEDCE